MHRDGLRTIRSVETFLATAIRVASRLRRTAATGRVVKEFAPRRTRGSALLASRIFGLDLPLDLPQESFDALYEPSLKRKTGLLAGGF